MNSILDSLRTKGLCVLGTLPNVWMQDIKNYFASKPVWTDAHVPETARREGRVLTPLSEATQSECVCVSMADALCAPHLLEAGLYASGAVDVARLYLETDDIFIYSASAFWTRPGPKPARPDIQELHRDKDDVRFLALFTYLTDVHSIDDGPHNLIGPDGRGSYVTGDAGTVFLADTSNMHCGLKPTTHERGIHWFRFGVSQRPDAYQWDKTEPVSASLLGDRYPSDPALRRMLSPLVIVP